MKAAKNQPMPGLAKQSITGSDGLFGQALMRLPRSTQHEPRKAACAPVPIDQRRGAAAESAATARSAPPPPLGAPPPPPAMPTRRPRAARGRSAGRRRRAGWPRAARSPCCRSRRPAARSTRCAPGRVDQRAAIGIATDRTATTRLKDSPAAAGPPAGRGLPERRGAEGGGSGTGGGGGGGLHRQQHRAVVHEPSSLCPVGSRQPPSDQQGGGRALGAPRRRGLINHSPRWSGPSCRRAVHVCRGDNAALTNTASTHSHSLCDGIPLTTIRGDQGHHVCATGKYMMFDAGTTWSFTRRTAGRARLAARPTAPAARPPGVGLEEVSPRVSANISEGCLGGKCPTASPPTGSSTSPKPRRRAVLPTRSSSSAARAPAGSRLSGLVLSSARARQCTSSVAERFRVRGLGSRGSRV